MALISTVHLSLISLLFNKHFTACTGTIPLSVSKNDDIFFEIQEDAGQSLKLVACCLVTLIATRTKQQSNIREPFMLKHKRRRERDHVKRINSLVVRVDLIQLFSPTVCCL